MDALFALTAATLINLFDRDLSQRLVSMYSCRYLSLNLQGSWAGQTVVDTHLVHIHTYLALGSTYMYASQPTWAPSGVHSVIACT